MARTRKSGGEKVRMDLSERIEAETRGGLRLAVYRSCIPGPDRRPAPRALALCSGGITGALFETGVLAALDDVIGDHVSTGFEAYLGVSAGATVATLVSQGVPAERLFRALYDESDGFFPLRREHLFQVNTSAWARSFFGLATTLVQGRLPGLKPAAAGGERGELADMLPRGVFRIDGYGRFVADVLERAGLSRSFDGAGKPLFIPAYDVDTGDRVVFGEPAHRDVEIPLAIAASSAIPVLYEPVRIGNRDYLDGGVGPVAHLDVLVEKGFRRILVVNPVVPIRNDRSRVCIPVGGGKCATLAEKGLAVIGNQAFRIMSKIRLDLGLRRLAAETPGLEVVLIEPGEEATLLFLLNPMGFSGRQAVLDYARLGARAALRDLPGGLPFIARSPRDRAAPRPHGKRDAQRTRQS